MEALAKCIQMKWMAILVSGQQGKFGLQMVECSAHGKWLREEKIDSLKNMDSEG